MQKKRTKKKRMIKGFAAALKAMENTVYEAKDRSIALKQVTEGLNVTGLDATWDWCRPRPARFQKFRYGGDISNRPLGLRSGCIINGDGIFSRPARLRFSIALKHPQERVFPRRTSEPSRIISRGTHR